MILRKPYAFLIKYFKLIHMILFAGILYVLFKSINLSIFFGNYITNYQGVPLYEDYSGAYTSTSVILVLIVIILISAVVLYLMKHKNKPIIFYVFNLIVYIIVLLLFFYASNFLYDLQFDVPDLRFTKILRDIYFTLVFVQIGSLILSFVRMTGFDIKKFDFQKDLMDFELSSEDREEFEFQLNIDTEDIKAKIRKRLRILKYNYKENKLLFFIFFAVVGIVFLSIILDFILGREKIYKEGTSFKTSAYKIEVLNSYKTYTKNLNDKLKSDKFYLIIKLNYENISGFDIESINMENAKVKLDEFYMVTPNKLLNDDFPEFGENYYNQSIKNGEKRIFTLVYEIDKKYYDSRSIYLRYLYDIEYKDSEMDFKYRTVKLKPSEFNNPKVIEEKKLGEEIIFKDSLLGNTKLNIRNIRIEQNFLYKAKYCVNNDCITRYDSIVPNFNSTYDLSVMRIDYDLSFDRKYLGNRYKNNKFFEDHGSIRFVIKGKEYQHKINLKDITPLPTLNYAFLEVRTRLKEAEKIYLDINVRNRIYTYIIK